MRPAAAAARLAAPPASSAATALSCARVEFIVRAQVDEEAVIAVDSRRAQRLTLHRQDALALFAGALGEQLLQPVRQR